MKRTLITLLALVCILGVSCAVAPVRSDAGFWIKPIEVYGLAYVHEVDAGVAHTAELYYDRRIDSIVLALSSLIPSLGGMKKRLDRYFYIYKGKLCGVGFNVSSGSYEKLEIWGGSGAKIREFLKTCLAVYREKHGRGI